MDGFRGTMVALMLVVLLILAPAWIWAQVTTPAREADMAELGLAAAAPAYGLTSETWAARLARWPHSLPMPIDPVADPTRERCGHGREEFVFLLAASTEGTGERTYAVPGGTALLIPLLGASCVPLETRPLFARDGGELPACIKVLFPPRAELTAVIDGVAMALDRYLVQSNLSMVALAEDDWLDLEPAVLENGVGCSWLLLAPLPPGLHKLRFGASLPHIGVFFEVTYRLTVAELVVVEQRLGRPAE